MEAVEAGAIEPTGATAPGRSFPAAIGRLFDKAALLRTAENFFWTCLSVGLFAGIWELFWWFGWADAKLLPPPHVFVGSIADQAKFFNTATRWSIGTAMNSGPSPFEAVLITVGATTGRVFSGLLIASVVAGLWEFSTSGLEMGMVFAWLGLSFWLLVRVGLDVRGRRWCAVVIGLGTLIRPELALMTVVFLASLVGVELLGEDGMSRSWWRRSLALLGWALLAPVAFELFRMGYYGLVVANTALAKDAGASWWSQGWVYLWNFLAPYWLVFPLLLGLCLLGTIVRRWVHDGQRVAVLLLVTPLVAGLVDVLYVVHLGGDYMHARLLLPGFVSLCLPLFASWRMRSTWLVVPVVLILGWSVVCAGWLRDLPPPPGPLTAKALIITNERNTWILATKSAHPITTGDYGRALSGVAGPLLKAEAAQLTPPAQALAVITDPFASVRTARRLSATSSLPFRLAVNVDGIGVLGDLAGSEVYLFDSFSLANPIGSHFPVRAHARPGHEKYIGPVWMVARFGAGAPRTIPGVATATEIADARAALACGELGRYLHAITAPLSVSRVWGNLVGAIGFTQLRVDPNPSMARTELCG